MDQITLGLDSLPEKTRKGVLLQETNRVVPLTAPVALIQLCARGARPALRGRPRFAFETMQHMHCLQPWRKRPQLCGA